MKRSFVRGLWGIYDHQGRRFYKRRTKIDGDIELLSHCKYEQSFVNYVFGEDNFKFLEDKGMNVRLIDKRNIIWDMDSQQFRHKLEIFKAASEEFDEFIFLDYDAMPIKKIPDDFWENLYKKEAIQAALRVYHRRKAYWRPSSQRQIPVACFVYIRDKQIPIDLIKLWGEMNEPWSEEVVMAKYIDDKMGGFNSETYWNRYDPESFLTRQGSLYSRELLATKKVIFDHFGSNEVSHYLNGIKNGKPADWLSIESKFIKE